MHRLPLFAEMSPLYLAQAAMTIWMLVDASRRGVESFWFWIILFFQPLGAWAYFFAYKIKDFSPRNSGNWFASLFARRTSLQELRYRVEQSPTLAANLELGERLVETGEYDEAEPLLQAVLKREPDHGTALFALAACHRKRGRYEEALPPLQKLVGQRPSWGNYAAWHTLIETHQQAGGHAEAVAQAAKLAQLMPSLEHKCLHARCLWEAGSDDEARAIVERALEAYRFSANPSRDDRRWVGKAKKLLSEMGE